jgi:hypothetical protein
LRKFKNGRIKKCRMGSKVWRRDEMQDGVERRRLERPRLSHVNVVDR